MSNRNADFCLNPAISALKSTDLTATARIVRRSVIEIGYAAAQFTAYWLYGCLLSVKERGRSNPLSTEVFGTPPFDPVG
jgi:hypothetical protein